MMTTPESSIEPGGLDLLNTDDVTAEELANFREFYSATKGSQNKSYEFWLEFRPDVLKRHKARTVQWYLGGSYPIQAMACLHQYVIRAFPDGIDYEMRLSQTHGAKKTDLLDLLSVAFIHAGHPGMYTAAEVAAPILRDYVEKPSPERFPANWDFDPRAFDCGMDYSTLAASPGDIRALLDWYQRTCGEVPRNIRFLADQRPDLLKAYRNRYEHAIRDSLPKQMLPYLMLHYNVYRGFGDGIRENVLLCRAMGLSRQQVLNAVCSAILHTGANGMDTVAAVAGDLFETFPDGE
jgi:hypothetical protein